MRNNKDREIKRYIDNYYTPQDATAFFHRVKDKQGRAEIAHEMDSLWVCNDVIDITEKEFLQYQSEAQELLRRIQKKRKTKYLVSNLWRSSLKYAAAIVFLLVSVTTAYFQFKPEPQAEYHELRVDYGEHKTVNLPDGTKVTLNAGTFFRYPSRFVADSRTVEIDGEGFFDVSRDEDKPFIIRTKDANIKVLGTSFNVCAYNVDEEISVAVRTGKVQVDLPEAMMRLSPNEQLILNRETNDLRRSSEKTDSYISWMKGGLYFNKTPLHTVIRELERMYNQKIEFAPDFVFDDYIYGEHENTGLESVLKSIAFTTGIKYKKEGDVIIIYE